MEKKSPPRETATTAAAGAFANTGDLTLMQAKKYR